MGQAPSKREEGLIDRVTQVMTLGLFLAAIAISVRPGGPIREWWNARRIAEQFRASFADGLHEAFNVGQVLGERGDSQAVLVEFFDYECPFCRQVEADFEEWRQANPKVLVIRVQYPLPNHPAGQRAAVAMSCARRYGNQSALHSALMLDAGWIDSVTTVDFALLADSEDALGFDACMGSPESLAEIERGLELGRSLGVSGTPTFAGRGGLLVGAGDLSRLSGILAE